MITVGRRTAQRLYNLTWTVNLDSGKRSTNERFDHAPLPRTGIAP